MAEAEDRLDFCKQALGELGTRSTIVSLDPPDGSQEAFYCNLFFEATRDQVLRAAHWNFAGRTEAVALWKAGPGTPENPTVPADFLWTNRFPAPPWLYSYSFPTDPSVQIRRVREQTSFAGGITEGLPIYPGVVMTRGEQRCAQFEVASDRFNAAGTRLAAPVRVILTNAQHALVDFTTSDVVIAEYDPMFGDAFMLAFEGKLALALLGDRALYGGKLQEANASIIEARVRDGNEGLTVYDFVPDWMQARGIASGAALNAWLPQYGPLFAV
jgi:hypothetical protein